MNIVLFDPEELMTEPNGATLAAADRRARHILDVLRLGPGDSFRAGVVDGAGWTGRLVSVEADGGVRIELEPGAVAQTGGVDSGLASTGAAARPLHPVRLLLGHPRPIVLRRLLRDLSTLGVEQLVVVRTELGEKSYLRSKLWQGDDVRRCLMEGAEQAGSTFLPRVEKAWLLADAIGQVVEGRETAPRVVFDNLVPGGPSGASGAPEDGAGDPEPPGADADAGRIIAVGSERGWTDAERAVLADRGFRAAALGERVLRTETAAVAAVALTLRELERI
jgi:16S rRNA U1498 N3-methylase RsmE